MLSDIYGSYDGDFSMSERQPKLTEMTAILDGLQEPALLLNPDYRILIANNAYRNRYKESGKVVNRFCYEVSHNIRVPCHKAGETCPMVMARRSGEPHRVLHIHHSSRGEEHVEVEGRPIHNEKGELIYFMEIIRHTRAASAQAEGEGLVGRSEAFNKMLGLMQRVAPSESTALLLGESGTGKELVAQAIHQLSPRGQALFVPVECSGLTESLFESELFGHEKGAFTGAHAGKTGLVETARGGTLFLDEVGDIPLSLQVKLLRLLETGTYRAVCSVDVRNADFRLICATHRDLLDMVEKGEFRRDLYYRISSFPIHLPALRERVDDLPLLSETLLKRIKGGENKHLSSEALVCLSQYDFPGNIRELRNILERGSLLTDGDLIRPVHLPEACQGSGATEKAEGILTLDEMERRYLLEVTDGFQDDREALAKKLGISNRTLYRKLQQIRKLD